MNNKTLPRNKSRLVATDCLFREHTEDQGSRCGALSVFLPLGGGFAVAPTHTGRYTVGAARERNLRGRGRARGGNRDRNVGRGLQHEHTATFQRATYADGRTDYIWGTKFKVKQ
jgi:hypothetical protein